MMKKILLLTIISFLSMLAIPSIMLAENQSKFKAGYDTTFYSTSLSSGSLPTEFSISPNYPNPFKAETNIEFALPWQANIKLSIYDINGRLVRTLIDESKDAGCFITRWHGMDFQGKLVSSGIYFGKLHITNQDNILYDEVMRMVLIK